MAKANKLIPVVDGTAGTPIELTDSRIEITNPAANDLLQYDSTQQQFVNTPASSVVPSHRTVNHEQITDSSLGDANLHDGFYFPNAVQDYDGNWYGAVVIGDQVWLGEHLRTTHYADGTAIPNGGSSTSTSTAYYYDYSTSSIPLEKRGYLYNWPAVMNGAGTSGLAPSGVQGIAPNGWHVPSYVEINNYLVNYVQKQSRFIYSNSPTKISKSLASTSYWNSNTAVAGNTGNDQSTNNATGLNIYPTGHRWSNGAFEYTTISSEIYTTTLSSGSENVLVLNLNYATAVIAYAARTKSVACSVRCVSNLTPLQFRDWYVKTYGTLQHKLDELPSMSGNSGKVLAVNSGETGVEWVTQSGGGGTEEVLVCNYDITNHTMDKTITDIYNAYTAGKIIVCKSNTTVYYLETCVDVSCRFHAVQNTGQLLSFKYIKYLNGTWSEGQDDWNSKQDKLIGTQTTGQNIKTINGNSLLGSGDLTIGGVTIYSGSTAPSSSTGSDGDIYIQTVS